MLQNSLFTIDSIRQEDNSNIFVLIRIDPSAEIFKGHFPGSPMLPGVCIIQIIKEIILHQTDKKLILDFTNSIKYLSVINPEKNSLVNIDLLLKSMPNGDILCDAVLHFGSDVFCRFKGNFKVFKKN